MSAPLLGLLLVLWASFGLGQPSHEQGSIAVLPPSLRAPSFLSGPYVQGHSVAQELELIETIRAIVVWLAPAEGYDEAEALVEIRRGLEAGSIRSAIVPAREAGGEVALAIDPALEPEDVGAEGFLYLIITAAPGSAPVRVGMTKRDSYPSGLAFIGNHPTWPDQDIYFQLVRAVQTPTDIDGISRLMSGNGVLRMVLAGLIIVAVSVLIATGLRNIRYRIVALLVGSLMLLFAVAISLDILDVGLIPSPQFPVAAILR